MRFITGRWHTLEKPVAILNLGGVGNVTYIGPQDADLLAGTGPGNALIDRWVRQEAGLPYDGGGKLASEGNVDQASIDRWLKHPYFAANRQNHWMCLIVAG